MSDGDFSHAHFNESVIGFRKACLNGARGNFVSIIRNKKYLENMCICVFMNNILTHL